MKKIFISAFVVFLLISAWAKEGQEIIEQAFALEKTDIHQAYRIMKEAKGDFPDDPDILSVYGYMAGFEAKETYKIRALLIVNSALSAFEQALEIDGEHKNARLWGGILKINMPSFLGKVPQGMEDLQLVGKRDDLTPSEQMQVKFFLGMGYEKTGQYDQAISLFQKVIEMSLDETYVKDSKMRIERQRQREREESLHKN